MSWLITLVAVGTGVAALSTLKAGKTQEIELEQQAEEEKLSAEAKELGRRQKLNKMLAANVVGLASSGISGEGTPQSIALASAKQASISEGLEGLTSRLKQSQLKRQGANVRAGSKLAAASTLLTGGVKIKELG